MQIEVWLLLLEPESSYLIPGQTTVNTRIEELLLHGHLISAASCRRNMY